MGFRAKALFLGLALMLIPFSSALIGRQSAGISGLGACLPADGEAGEWRVDGPPQEFRGDNLFEYIDGGAEIYREYGFVRVLVQEYKNSRGKKLSLEIFEMASPTSAYGVFTFKRSSRGEPVHVGSEAELEDYYLNFWQGSYIITITGYGKDSQSRQGLMILASAVSKRLPGRPVPPPPLVAALPQPGLVRTSVRYLRGYLGFMNTYPSLGQAAFRFEEAVKGDYSSGASLYLLNCGSESECRATFAAVEKAVAADTKAGGVSSEGGLSLRTLDDRGKRLSVRVDKNYLLVCLEPTAGRDAQKLFELVRLTH